MDLAQPDKDALTALGSWWGGLVDWIGTFSWGTAPDWVAAVGTVGTLVAALWQQYKERKRLAQLEKKEAERAAKEEARQRRLQAQRVTVHLGPAQIVTSYGNGRVRHGPIHKVTVTNSSDAPIHGLTLHEPGGPQIRYYGSLPTNESWIPGVPPEKTGTDENVEVSFFDADGYEWLLDALGNLYDEDSREFQTRWEPRASAPDPVTPEPTPPAPGPPDAPPAPPRPDESS